MKTNGYKRGSVLMEFIIVFPIYLILFAGTIATGDMLIHSNRLVSADRVLSAEVDGHGGGMVSRTSAWDMFIKRVFHPGVEIADDGFDQDSISKNTNMHYADSTGPWSVCALATAQDNYKLLAGGTLGQLLSVPVLLGPAGNNVNNNSLNQLALPGGLKMVSKDTRNGAGFYTLKRRDHYRQRNEKRHGTNKYIDEDSRNWRDRHYVSRLLRTQRGPGTENWRLEVAGENWHTADTINGGGNRRLETEASGGNIPEYKRFGVFVTLSE